MAIKLNKGQKIDLTKKNPNLKKILVGLGWESGQGIDLDTAAFLLDSSGKVASDSDFIFYGNLKHSSGSVEHSGDDLTGGSGDVEQIRIDLTKIPKAIDRISFTATIYEPEERHQNFSMVRGSYIRIVDSETSEEILRFNLEDFSNETAIVVAEIYRHGSEWKFNAIGAGFSGGLEALCKNFGVDVSDSDPKPVEDPKPNKKISLEKKISEGAPKLISLVKPLKVELEKRNLLDVVAKVALVMDKSGSMSKSYSDGTVQEIVNKILPVAVQFDDDGALDFWFYASKCERRPAITMQNYETAISSASRFLDGLFPSLGFENNEPAVMREVIAEFEYSKLPVYVIFVTDGGIYKTVAIKNLLMKSSRSPIFWQFVGVRGHDYGILEELDDMSGRYIDNADFFALDDFKSVPDSELYSRLLNEFPSWLKEARSKNLI